MKYLLGAQIFGNGQAIFKKFSGRRIDFNRRYLEVILNMKYFIVGSQRILKFERDIKDLIGVGIS